MIPVPTTLRETARFSLRATRLAADQLRRTHGCTGNPRGLALFHWGRCGSTVLGFLLNQHPCVYWDGEALMFERKSERWLRRLQGARGESGLDDLRRLMRYALDRTYAFYAYGPLGYSSSRELIDDLLTLGFDRFVVLERKNTLRRVVSANIGMQHKVWVLRRGKSPMLRQVELPLQFPNGDTLLHRIRTLQDWYAKARQALSGLPTLELTYEEQVLQDPRVAYRLVCNFIGLEAAPVRVLFERVNPFPLQQMVTNYDAIAAALRDTEFEWMLTG
jgi:hypothetical protein